MNAAAIRELVRPEVPALAPYNAGLSSQAVRSRYGVEQIARLASNENPFGASPAVAQALAGLALRVGTYPDANCTALRAAIAERTGASAEQVVIGNGSESILQMLCQAFLSPGDRVLTQRPAFGLHEIYPRMMGAQVELLALTPALEFDLGAWCEALARGPKIAMLANPSNPVGCMFERQGFARLLEATPAGTLLVIDEAYYEYAQRARGFPDALAALRAQQRPWIVLRTFSKAWGLAGLRVGYGIASDASLVQWLDRVRTPFNVNEAAQAAALAAWGDEAFMAQTVAQTVTQREWLVQQLRALALPGLRIAPSAANFLFIDLARPNGPVNEALLARGIIVKPWKEAGFESFIRVSIGTAEDNARFLGALGEILGGH
ncbi:histidinol-phosphate transaminase [Variovorax saccharolyticus]|uniref:histidinol-phosphate transaminase n=1 Tax=Variovorax saccharolyticus TaxID=3053516 RepID=UPI002575F483|nr:MULTISPECIES: histidinol-phosphate transaminase [unclassified Variovorax]MDM0021749.1 histidinol-phosphate transaminase [Variovorax sp. J22R187]MDM0027996.1 histidinol-phosphate transaminase [Variovorax sp. J31P216]